LLDRNGAGSVSKQEFVSTMSGLMASSGPIRRTIGLAAGWYVDCKLLSIRLIPEPCRE
jgi:hypothetical protein